MGFKKAIWSVLCLACGCLWVYLPTVDGPVDPRQSHWQSAAQVMELGKRGGSVQDEDPGEAARPGDTGLRIGEKGMWHHTGSSRGRVWDEHAETIDSGSGRIGRSGHPDEGHGNAEETAAERAGAHDGESARTVEGASEGPVPSALDHADVPGRSDGRVEGLGLGVARAEGRAAMGQGLGIADDAATANDAARDDPRSAATEGTRHVHGTARDGGIGTAVDSLSSAPPQGLADRHREGSGHTGTDRRVFTFLRSNDTADAAGAGHEGGTGGGGHEGGTEGGTSVAGAGHYGPRWGRDGRREGMKGRAAWMA